MMSNKCTYLHQDTRAFDTTTDKFFLIANGFYKNNFASLINSEDDCLNRINLKKID